MRRQLVDIRSRGDAFESAGFVLMRIQTDHLKCTGNGLCAGTSPTVFDVSDDGYVEVLQDVPDADLERAGAPSGNQLPDTCDYVDRR